MEQQGGRLKILESENRSLSDQVEMMNKSLSAISLDKEELRNMNEQSSAELKKALEVSTVQCCWLSKYSCLCEIGQPKLGTKFII